MNSFRYFKSIVKEELAAFREQLRESKGPLLLLLISIIAVLVYLKPFPDKHVSFATSYAGSDWHVYGDRAAAHLKPSGISVKLVNSAGAVENADLLNDSAGAVNAGFTYGAALAPAQVAGIYSLGSIGYEPVWIFYRKNLAGKIDGLKDLAQYRVGLGPAKSGSYVLTKRLFQTINIDVEGHPKFKSDAFPQTKAAFLKGELDVFIRVASHNDAIVQELLHEPTAKLFSFKNATAYEKRFNDLDAIILPAGSIDIYNNIPAEDVSLIATTTTLAVRKDMHPDLQLALLMAAKELNRNAPSRFFSARNQFPEYVDTLIPISPVAQRFYDYGPPQAMRYLPYWLAGFVDRAWLLLLTLFAVFYPLSRLNIQLRKFRFALRERPLYDELLAIEKALCQEPLSPERRADFSRQLDRINQQAVAGGVPSGEEARYFSLLGTVRDLRLKLQRD